MLFPEWGQGRHCSCSQELRGDRLQKLHLILTYVVLGCQRRAGWDPQERPVRVRTMVLAQPAPPLNTCCGSHLCSGLGTDALRVSVQGPPPGQPYFSGGETGWGAANGRGHAQRHTAEQRCLLVRSLILCQLRVSQDLQPGLQISTRLLPESQLCSLLSACPMEESQAQRGEVTCPWSRSCPS